MPEQSLIGAAKAPIIGYNKKDWNAVRAAVTPGFLYDEIPTQRKIQGVDQVLVCWQGWASAIPGEATFHNALVSGNTVVLEVTWRGTHTGPLQMPARPIPPTGKTIAVRACQVFEIAGGKVQTMRHYFDVATLLQQLDVTV